MQVTVSRVSPVEIALRVALPKDRVSVALERAYDELGRKAQIRGFRKGKVPRTILRQYYGSKVTNEVFRKLVDETLPGALKDQRIDPVQTLQIAPDSDLDGAMDWSYTAHLEVRPEIPAIDLSALSLTRKVYTIDEHDVDQVLEARREQGGTLRTPEPMRPAVKGDSVTFDLAIAHDGVALEEFGTHGRTAEIGNSGLLAAIEEAFVGMSPGESRTIDVDLPSAHRQKELAGKRVQITLAVHELQEKILPDLDDEFAKDVGKESLADLKASIRADLEQRFRDQSDEDLQDQALNSLIERHPITAPPTMIDGVLAQIRQEYARHAAMEHSGAGLPSADLMRAEAENRVRAGLLLSEIAQRNELRVTEEDMNARMEEIAKASGKAIQKLRVEYRDQRKRDMLFSGVMQHKVMALLLSKATITDENVATHQHDHDHDHDHDHGAPAESPAASAPAVDAPATEHKE